METKNTTKTHLRKKRQELIGQVVGVKMQKTICVLTYRLMKEKKYGKYIRKKSIFKAHDEKSKAQLGDTVRIFEVKPISKTKRWMLDKVLEKQELSS